MQKHTGFYLFILVAVLAVAGLVAAQDDGEGGVPIQPAASATHTSSPTPLVTATTTPTLVASPMATSTQPALLPSSTATSQVPASVTAVVTATLIPPTSTPAPLVTSVPVTINPVEGTFTPTPIPFDAIIDVESAFIREAPSFDANPAASAFRDEPLTVIGRNLDGKWFEVSRPYRNRSLGWVNQEVIDFDFPPEYLPLTDITTSVNGPNPLSTAPEFGVFVVEGVALRTLPDQQLGQRLLNIPPNVVVPVTARYRDGDWLQVNYLGTQGWIIGFTTRPRPDILDLPQISGLLPPEKEQVGRVLIVPPEIQQAQLDRMRDYAREYLVIAQDTETFWWMVGQGDVMPCNPPPSIVAYRYSGQDVRELPEMDRHAPRMNEGLDMLDKALEPIDRCGVIDPFDVSEARNDAINAKIILQETINTLNRIEELIN